MRNVLESIERFLKLLAECAVEVAAKRTSKMWGIITRQRAESWYYMKPWYFTQQAVNFWNML